MEANKSDINLKEEPSTSEDLDGSTAISPEPTLKHEVEQTIEQKPVPREQEEIKFSGRYRLFVGNIPMNLKQDEFEALFKPFGEYMEPFLSDGKGFGFIRMVCFYKSNLCVLSFYGMLYLGF